MSLYRARKQRKRWRLKWPWSVIFPIKIDERFCRECGLPFHEGPIPKTLDSVTVNSVTSLIFPPVGFRKGEYMIRLGKWIGGKHNLYCSEFITPSDLDDMELVIERTREAVKRLKGQTRERYRKESPRLRRG